MKQIFLGDESPTLSKITGKNLKSIIQHLFILELWYRTVIVEITHKMQTSFKTLASTKTST